jgi:hypothetical protein
MLFCPDEKELVMEIFQQLGSGATIRDVPVRFRAKDGSIKNLLIDSNVKWKTDDKGERQFDHTRCFIRDDTRRKVGTAMNATQHTVTAINVTQNTHALPLRRVYLPPPLGRFLGA